MNTTDMKARSLQAVEENQSKAQDPPVMFSSNENMLQLENQVIENLKKPNIPNVNVPERIVICLDVCHDDKNSLYRLGDGSTFTPTNMLKRILDFYVYSKYSINKKTEFALLLMKNNEACWVQNFTNNMKDILSSIDHISPEESTSETFDFAQVFETIKQNVELPVNKLDNTILSPPYVVRALMIYARSNCLPVIPQDDEYVMLLKKQLYFYLDILYTHEEECALFKCAEIYDALQDLDNGYSYVYEVSRNARKIHDCIAKLLAHPLQRPLQKNTDYSFGSKHGL